MEDNGTQIEGRSLRTRHGGPMDRGSADAYYGRPAAPHYFEGDTYQTEKIEEDKMSIVEINQYNIGYNKVIL